MKAIVTRADENVKDWIDCTHGPMKEYAKKCDADFFIFDHDPVEMSHLNKYQFWRILEVKNLFEKGYDRILHLDTDVLVTPNAPNLFEVVDEDHIGVVFEDCGTRKNERLKRIKQIQAEFGNCGWKSGYPNEGVMIFSKKHKNLFESINGKWVNTSNGPSQGHFGWKMHDEKMLVTSLSYKFNFMSMFSEQWNGNKSRFDAFFIHYAGGANFPDKGERSRIQIAIDDKKILYNG